MIELPGSFSGILISPRPERGTAREPTHVVGDLGERRGKRLQRAVQMDERVMRSQRFEFVGCGNEWQTRECGDLFGGELTESRQRIEACTHSGAAESQLKHMRQRGFDMLPRMIELRHVAGKFLAERQRGRVLQMRAPDLDNVGERRGSARQRRVEARERRNEVARYRFRGGNMHRGRKYIVRGLAAIDFVVRMHEPARPARTPQQFRCAIGEDFVDVHVGLGPGSGLPDRERKLISEPAGDSFVGRGDNRFGGGRLKNTKLQIDARRGTLDDQQRPHQCFRHLLGGNPKVQARALGLRSPEPIRRDFDRSEAVALGAGFDFSHGLPRFEMVIQS
jgi:hypothetical protein